MGRISPSAPATVTHHRGSLNGQSKAPSCGTSTRVRTEQVHWEPAEQSNNKQIRKIETDRNL